MVNAGKYNILVVDDDQGFLSMIQRFLLNGGYRVDSSNTAADALEKLKESDFDLILLDYQLPDVNAADLLDNLQTNNIVSAVVIITGHGDEKLAVEMLKKGAVDYLVKDSSFLEQLPNVIRQALRCHDQQKLLNQAQQSIVESQEQYRGIFNSATDAFLVIDSDGRIAEANPQALATYQYEYNIFVGMPFDKLCEKDNCSFRQISDIVQEQGEYYSETLHRKKSEEIFDVEIKANVFGYRGRDHLLVVSRDISERKWSERELKLTNQQLQLSEKTVRQRETRLRTIFQGSAIGIALLDLAGRTLESNQTYQLLLGYSNAELNNIVFSDLVFDEDRKGSLAIFEDLVNGKCEHYRIEQRYLPRNRIMIWVRVTASLIRSDSGEPDHIVNIVEDISERKSAEDSFQQSKLRYRSLFENMLDGFACHKVVFDENSKPVDYIFIEVNEAFENMTGLMKEQLIGRELSNVFADFRDSIFDWDKLYDQVIDGGKSVRYDVYSDVLDRWFSVAAYSPEHGYCISIIEDISERRQIEEELRIFATELEGSNRDLEQFAHTASDELSKQLDSISVVVEQLTANYPDAFNPQTVNDLHSVIANTEKMRNILDGLLVYSKMAYRANPFDNVDLSHVFTAVKAKYDPILAKSGGKIDGAQLPTVYGDGAQLAQIFDSMFQFVLEFASDDPLLINVFVNRNDDFWIINFSAPGLYIPPDDCSKLFLMFQPITVNQQLRNTGIAMALCRKVLLRHNGDVKIFSEPNKPNIIKISLPAEID